MYIKYTEYTKHTKHTGYMMLVYTRYLYSYEHVKMSFIISLLNKDLDQSYYWIYEIYYSGFETLAFELCLLLFREIYSYRKQIYEKMVEEYKSWKMTNDPLYLATITKNLVSQNISIAKFVKVFCKEKGVKDEKRKNATTKFMYASNEEIAKFETCPNTGIYTFKLLQSVLKYEIRHELNEIFNTPSNSHKFLTGNWLYYASKSPIWQERIAKYNGYIDEEQKQVTFQNVNNEDEFYELYDYEPDEQPLHVKRFLLGKQDVNYLDKYYLCKLYGGIYNGFEES